MAGHGAPGDPAAGFQVPPRQGMFGAGSMQGPAAFGAPQMAYGNNAVFGGPSPGMPMNAGVPGGAMPSSGSFGAGGYSAGSGFGGMYGAGAVQGAYGDSSQAYQMQSAGGVMGVNDQTGWEEDYGGGFDLDWQDQRQAEWQDRIHEQYFSRWSVDKLDEWQAYQSRFDAAHDGGNAQAGLAPPQWQDTFSAPRVASKEELASAEEYRRQTEMQVISAFGAVPLPVRSFETSELPPATLREVKEAGFVEPTPIQAQCWPILSAGHDLIGIAKSGSGKTLGFLGPAFTNVLRSPFDVQKGPMVLVLAPTRELARQIQLEALKFGRSAGILCCAVTGGEPKGEQLEWIKRGCHVIVATPGRLNEFIEQRHVWLGQVGYIVLDEADRMLDMGFEPQIRRIVDECPKGPERQTLLFSATWPKAVRQLAFEFLRRPLHVHIGEMNAAKANTDVEQRAHILDRATDKDQLLFDILTENLEKGQLAIVFVATKKSCQDVSLRLQERGFGVAEIHGDKDQRERDLALHAFVNMTKNVLVATDVASRGLDIKGVKHVVNYDAANTPEDHVHRIGRTGRAGEKGISYTFLVRGDTSDIRKGRAVIEVMETASQEVPADLRLLAGMPANRGGGKSGGGKRGGGFKGGGRKGGKGSMGSGKGGGGGGFNSGGPPKGASPAPGGFGGGGFPMGGNSLGFPMGGGGGGGQPGGGYAMARGY